MTRDDVVRITEQVLKDLTIEVKENSYCHYIILKYKDKEISKTALHVKN